MKFTYVIMALAFQLPFIAIAGTSSSGGGDGDSIEFVQMGYRLNQALRASPMPDFSIDAFSKAIEATTVNSTDQQLLLGGMVKDAINYPLKGEIVFNLNAWEKANFGRRIRLVFHEYLGILGADDSSYQITNRLDQYTNIGAWGVGGIAASQQRTDGNFDVLCSDGSFEIVNQQDLNNNNVCPHSGGGQMPNNILSIMKRPDGSFNVICKNLSTAVATADDIVYGRVCSTPSTPLPPPDLGDIVRNSDGSIHTMDRYEAETYCRSIGWRLPNRREYALLSASLGAGFRETAYPNIPESDKRVELEIFLMRQDGGFQPRYLHIQPGIRVIDFYYKSGNYHRPVGDLGDNEFWLTCPGDGADNFCFYQGSSGTTYGGTRPFNQKAVRCAR